MSFGEYNVQLWWVQGQTERSLLVSNVKTSSLILSEEGIGRLVCIPCVLVGVNLEVGVNSFMKRILEACSWRLTTCGKGCTASGGERLLQAIILLLMTIGMAATDLGQGPLLVSLFRMIMITIISVEVRVYLAEVWATML